MTHTFLQEQKAILVAVQTPDRSDLAVEDALQELVDLFGSLGGTIAGKMVQVRAQIHPGTVIGKGKLEELADLVKLTKADVVIFDMDLAPSQGQKLEKALEAMVLDRTQLILDIFHNNARTHEARIQVELAQLQYMLPRLVGMWAHLDRERGGIAGSKGTGEKQINIDRHLIRQRITRLKKEIQHVSQERHTQGRQRQQCFQVSLVGYTNAGKSTLMNRLTGAGVKAENRLFATLDSTTRVMDNGPPPVLLSDTVGFIQRLPHDLVASFHSTLEVAREADLLLQVVDVSHPAFEEHMATTLATLTEIEADTVPRLLVLNKADAVKNRTRLAMLKKQFPEAVVISAINDPIGPLREQIKQFLHQRLVHDTWQLSPPEQWLLAHCYRLAMVDDVTPVPPEETVLEVRFSATESNMARLRHLRTSPTPVLWEDTAEGSPGASSKGHWKKTLSAS